MTSEKKKLKMTELWEISVPPPPEPPLDRKIKEGSTEVCSLCGSSLTVSWGGKVKGCIQPKCRNFWDIH